MKHLKDYIRLVLKENEVNTSEKNQEALVEDLLNMFSNKIKKERFKKIGLSLLKSGSATILSAVEGIETVADILDENGVIKDQAIDAIKKSTSRLGLDKFIARFAERKKPKEKDILNIDPEYSKIVDNKVEKAFIIDYKKKLEQNKDKTLSEFYESEGGDITVSFEKFLENNFKGRSVRNNK